MAYELAKAGRRVTVIERDSPGTHASGKNPGNLNPILATPPALRPLALAAFESHQTLQQELSRLGCEDYRVEAVKRLLVSRTAADRAALEPVRHDFTAQPGFSARWLEASALHDIEPRLATALTSGLLLEGNRSLDARAFQHALWQGALAHGAQYLSATVTRITPLAHGYGVELDAMGSLEGETLVWATGPWVADIGRWLTIALPIVPLKGELLRLRLTDGNITHDITEGPMTLYRRGDAEVWVGVTRQAAGFDSEPSLTGKHWLWDHAARVLPAIAEAELLEHLAALRPITADELPIIGPVPGHPSLYIANGGGSKGMLLSAAVGRAIRDLIVDGHTALPIAAFAPRPS